MTLKKPHTISKMLPIEAALLEEDLRIAYENKIESRTKRTDSTTVTVLKYQQMEHGEVDFSANGSQATQLTFNLAETHTTIVYAVAHAKSEFITAHVTDITNTAITIVAKPFSSTALFSSVTTATVKVYYQVIGSNP